MQDALEFKPFLCLKTSALLLPSVSLSLVCNAQGTHRYSPFLWDTETLHPLKATGDDQLRKEGLVLHDQTQQQRVCSRITVQACTCLPVELKCKIKQLLQDRLKELNILSPSQTNSSLKLRSTCPQGRCQFSLYCVGKGSQLLSAADPTA